MDTLTDLMAYAGTVIVVAASIAAVVMCVAYLVALTYGALKGR